MGSSSSDVKYQPCPWAPSTVNVANFVTVKPCLDEERINFKIWKEQMLCLLESQDMLGFVNGWIIQPPVRDIDDDGDDDEQKKQWRRTDRLVKGWILGSIGKDALHAVWEKQTARDVWLELDNIFNKQDSAHQSSAGEDLSRYLELYQAALRGDWSKAQDFFQKKNLSIRLISTTIISADSETALHVAVLAGKANIDFVNKLVRLTASDGGGAAALALKDSYGDTALHNAGIVGNTEAAVVLVDQNPELLYILNKENQLPVLKAAIYCQKETLKYLISQYDPNAQNNNPFKGQLGIDLLNAVIASEFLDIALDLAKKYPDLAGLRDGDGDSALSTIAETDTLFLKTETFTWRQNFIYRLGQKVGYMIWNVIEYLVSEVKELREKKATHEEALQLVDYLCKKIVDLPQIEASEIFRKSIINAAEYGISEIVVKIINNYPMATFNEDDSGRNIFLLAANYRFENVINLLHNMSDRKNAYFSDCTDNEENNLMHVCGKLAPPNRLNLVPGAALQMQRELQWFKEMENFVNPSRRTWVNSGDQTPQMIFTKEHEKLKADGERWMKDTANACTIAAALIATVVFAAAFTAPGGVESGNTGIPLFSGEPAFVLFAISDAVSLFTSVTSLLMFLSILTSRYAEEDFLYVLPKRLSIGLLSLFVSITFMMVAFSATFYLVFHGDGAWFLLLLAAFACFPVTSFVLLQFPLLVDVVYSTYGPGIFGKKSDLFLY
ncbi:hypothetical protein C2S52_023278 [Perilla frutescens var. hirtella]|nr:hypothetical protein C2S52_023278 [Perilla frutescens var. hirtella]